jgi:hypothetical protein
MTDMFLVFANITAVFALWLVGMATVLIPLLTY